MKVLKVLKNNQSFMNVNVNLDKLELIEKALGIKLRAQVGVLGSSPHNRIAFKPRMATERNAKGIGRPSKRFAAELTNAEIGFKNEFGSVKEHIPARSFLWMPLSLYLYDEIQKKAPVLNRLISLAEVHKAYAMLGIIGENVVQAAFQTRGFGQWAPNSPRTIAQKGSDAPLIDTAQLRASVTSRVL